MTASPRAPMAVGARTVVTPEAVVLDLPVAGVGSRVLSVLVDQVALVAVWLLALWATAVVGIDPTLTMLVLALLLLIVVPAVVETLTNGRSLGKWLLGLRIVTVQGGPVSASQAFLRSMLMMLDLYVSLGFLGVAAGFSTERCQRLGDLAAGTVAIRERVGPSRRRSTVPEGAVTFVPAPAWVPFASSLDTTALDDDRYALVRSFLLRYPSMEAGERGRLAVRIADDVAARLRYTPPMQLDPVEFLTSVAAAQQRRRGATGGTAYHPVLAAVHRRSR